MSATPPAGPVSLSQIGVKSKLTTAEQIAFSVAKETPAQDQPATPTTPTTPKTPIEPSASKDSAPKKKTTKKVVKKEATSTSTGEGGPVPPPRKKEKKPKDK